MIYTDGTHLVADMIDELHAFASRLGLKRTWFQNRPRHPHYDLTTKSMAMKAEKLGAKRITARAAAQIAARTTQ